MICTFFVAGPLPGMNEIVAAAKSGRGARNAYSRLKATWTNAVAVAALSRQVGKFASPVSLTCLWREPNAKRDPDNVHAGVKFVLDGLVMAGAIAGDGQKHVARVEHRPIAVYSAREAGVWVTIEGEALR